MVLTSLDGDAGLDLAIKVRPDLLVVGDSVATRGGGLLADHLRARPELTGARVITIAQRAHAGAREPDRQAAGLATLELPFRPSAISALLRPGG